MLPPTAAYLFQFAAKGKKKAASVVLAAVWLKTGILIFLFLKGSNKMRFWLLKARDCHANLRFARNDSLFVRGSKYL